MDDKKRGAYACPGFFRMPMAEDGRLCRIKLPLGALTLAQLKAIAQCAERFGNGIIELTTRANIQLRGIRDDTRQQTIDILSASGLGPAHKEGDDIRNVMISPTAGIDCSGLIDTRPLGMALIERLQQTDNFRKLSPKFSFLLNGGEATQNNCHISDIWLAIDQDGAHYFIGLAGCPAKPAPKQPLLMVPHQHALAAIEAILALFCHWQAAYPKLERMKDLYALNLYDDFVEALCASSEHIHKSPQQTLACQQPTTFIGKFGQKNGKFFVAAKPFLGRLTAPRLKRLIAILSRFSQDLTLNITWQQSIIIANLSDQEANLLLEALAPLDWLITHQAIAANMVCCAGFNQCGAALADVQQDAHYLKTHIGANSALKSIHITGCDKSCAANFAHDITLLAKSPRHYGVYRRQEGQKSRFGALIFDNASIDDVVALLNSY